MLRDRYLNIKEGVCPLGWVMVLALTVVHQTNIGFVSVFHLPLAKVIIILRRGRSEETNLCEWKWGMPAKNSEIAKCN